MAVSTLTGFLSRWKSIFPTEEKRMRTHLSVPLRISARLNASFADGVTQLRRGPVEVAFDHDNRDVIMETDVAAETCRAVKDIDRQLFRGE
jgi:hypothetical protein